MSLSNLTLVNLLKTVVALVVFIAVMAVTKRFFPKQARVAPGYSKFVDFIFILVGLAVGSYVAYLWGFFEVLVGAAAAAGIVALIFGLSIVPWLSDAFSGVRIFMDPAIDVGSDVEVAGHRGRIIEISLTRTKIQGDGCIIHVPNRKFRDDIVITRPTKPEEESGEY